jgi:hypothetical protein
MRQPVVSLRGLIQTGEARRSGVPSWCGVTVVLKSSRRSRPEEKYPTGSPSTATG